MYLGLIRQFHGRPWVATSISSVIILPVLLTALRTLMSVSVKASAVFIYTTQHVIAFGIPIVAKPNLKYRNIRLLMSPRKWHELARTITAMAGAKILKIVILQTVILRMAM